MSNIALYNVLKKVGATHEEAEQAVADVASSKDIATKADIEKLEGKVAAIQWMVGLLVVMNVGLFVKLFM